MAPLNTPLSTSSGGFLPPAAISLALANNNAIASDSLYARAWVPKPTGLNMMLYRRTILESYTSYGASLAAESTTTTGETLIEQCVIPPELLLIIFEHQDSSTLAALRRVSQSFKALATPLRYRQIALSDNIIFCFMPSLCDKAMREQIANDIRIYTKHIIVKRSVEADGLLMMFNALKDLQHVTWLYWARHPAISSLVPHEIRNLFGPALRARWPKLRMLVEGVSDGLWGKSAPMLMSSMTTNLVSLKVDATWHQLLNRRIVVPTVKHVLLANRSLSVVHLGQPMTQEPMELVDWKIKKGERLPPFKELVLHNCNWPFKAASAINFWDWSKISHLELRKVPIIKFLRTVSPGHLRTLRIIKTGGNCGEKDQLEASSLLTALIKSIRSLTEIAIKVQLCRDGVVAAITEHGASLRTLECGNYIPTKQAKWHGLDSSKLQSISTTHHRLTELTIDMDSQTTGPLIDPKIFSTFRNLRRLHITVPIRHLWLSSDIERRIREGLSSFFEQLIAMKAGAEFETIHIGVVIGEKWHWFHYHGKSIWGQGEGRDEEVKVYQIKRLGDGRAKAVLVCWKIEG